MSSAKEREINKPYNAAVAYIYCISMTIMLYIMLSGWMRRYTLNNFFPHESYMQEFHCTLPYKPTTGVQSTELILVQWI